MKISLEWLSEFTSGNLDETAVANALTAGGLNVESVQGYAAAAVLDVEVTSNRADCLCHIGVAREVAALLGREFTDVKMGASIAAGESPVTVRIDAPAACPHYTAQLIRGVRIAPSPPEIARRLTAIGLRPINNVVDVTNYVLMEMGQPLHAFDFAHVGGGVIVVRQAHAGEKLVTLDGHERTLAESMLVIADQSRPIALAGVMGGAGSEVNNATVDVLLESARFDPLSVRRTSRTLALRSDSSYRFERGLDPTLPVRASRRAAELILRTAGGQLVGGLAAAGNDGYRPKTLCLRLAQITRLLGITLSADEVVQALSRLQLSPTLQGDKVHVRVPSWRLDLNIEADLIEEVARLIGYDRVPSRSQIAIRLHRPDASVAALEQIREFLIAAGFYESVTFSFVSDRLKDDFFPPGSVPLRADATVRKADATLRPSLLPGLLEAQRHNEMNQTPGARLFEIGAVFAAGKTPDEQRKLSLVAQSDWRDLRGVVESLLAKLDCDKPIRFTPAQRVGFDPGACALVEWNGKAIGFAGLIDRGVSEKLSLRQTPMACELDLNALLAGAVAVARQRPLPQFPPSRRDLSLVVNENLPYQQIEQTLLESKPAHLEEIEYVATFRGKPLEAGTKSVTVTLVFRDAAGTLTGEQVEAAVSTAVAAAEQKLSATLRK